MIKLVSATYLLGATFVIAALAVAYTAVTRQALPLVGSERGELISRGGAGHDRLCDRRHQPAAGGLVNPSNGL